MATFEAIGFDLFNTLITVHPDAMKEAHKRMIQGLSDQGFPVQPESFLAAYAEAAKRYLRQAHENGKETHNRFWIAAALEHEGYHAVPSDPRIEAVVDAYFGAFYPYCRLVPETTTFLGELHGRLRLGLLTNFTDGIAGERIIQQTGLSPFFTTIIISGRLGYRKPHPYAFHRLVRELGVPASKVLFVGDDYEADFEGAKAAGLQPVLTTYVRESNIPSVYNPTQKEFQLYRLGTI